MPITFRQATINDLQEIVDLLADDFLGRQREDPSLPLDESYVVAFRAIEADTNNELIVADDDREIIGTLQLTLTPSLSYRGGKRCTVESVRVAAKRRGQGIGHRMMVWANERAKQKGCVSIQLTTNTERTDAHRFYEKLDFVKSHVGMKLLLK